MFLRVKEVIDKQIKKIRWEDKYYLAELSPGPAQKWSSNATAKLIL